MAGKFDKQRDLFGRVKSSFDTNAGHDVGIERFIEAGAIDPQMLGLINHGDALSSIAHSTETQKRFSNVINGMGAKALYTQHYGEDGVTPITTPFMDNGKLVFPDKTGKVRNISSSYVELHRQLYEQLQDKIDVVMKYAIVSDELAKFVFGVSDTEYESLVRAESTPNSYQKAIGMSAEMAKIDSHVQYIHSLPESLSQTQAVGKLRYIVGKYLKNINIRDLISKSEFKKDIKEGKNNPLNNPATADLDLPASGGNTE